MFDDFKKDAFCTCCYCNMSVPKQDGKMYKGSHGKYWLFICDKCADDELLAILPPNAISFDEYCHNLFFEYVFGIVEQLYRDKDVELKIMHVKHGSEITQGLFIVTYDDLGDCKELDCIDRGDIEYLRTMKDLICSGIEKIARMECTMNEVVNDIILLKSTKWNL